ncbi:vWA domain-containing protein [Psychromonas aquimarina]|uniref:vWA domain-containing protein n=1 Tax=Psychromonas aquimarina TaxID=444919 RepID=UPI0003FD174A|nr:VWA domain-containing protein [Psychromonas aquimarina]
MKYSMQKSAQAAALSCLFLVTACGPMPQVGSPDNTNNPGQKEQPLSKDNETGAVVTDVREVDAIESEELADHSLRLTKNDDQVIQPAVKPLPQVVKLEEQRQTQRKQEKSKMAYMGSAAAKMAAGQPSLHHNIIAPPMPLSSRENYSHNTDNPFHLVTEQPVSTFSIDVDTASYANVRRILNQGTLPPFDAVRVEEMINYFSYNYAQPQSGSFSVYSEVGPSPFNAQKHLIHIGIQGDKMQDSARPAANLVFLLDVSGSMNSADKLGLLKNALKMLSRQLTANDSVAIVVYAGAAGTVLEPTKGDNNAAIVDALTRLSAGGSTNGGAGIELAYRLAQQSFIKDGINRVILATDGDFNVGMVNQQALKNRVEQQRKSGVSLSILGFGRGNYNDALMQELAQNGNGNAFYIDNLNEARKVLVEELSSTLLTIAKDVKIQIEFNPSIVSEYRLIGYETRALKREDFNNDKIDAGDIGAGHTVTAIYEISLRGAANQSVDPLRYQSAHNKKQLPAELSEDKIALNELAFLKLRYKLPQQNTSKLIEIPINSADIKASLQDTSETFQFSAAVAGFGQLLRGGKYLSTMDISRIIKLAQLSKGQDKHGYRGEFINMVKLADALAPQVAEKRSLKQ